MLLRLREGAEDVKGKGKAPETMEVDVPLHLRYQRPVQERWERGQRADMIEVELPWPRVFWSCDVSQGELYEQPSKATLTSHRSSTAD